jgi:hypothetical protein
VNERLSGKRKDRQEHTFFPSEAPQVRSNPTQDSPCFILYTTISIPNNGL